MKHETGIPGIRDALITKACDLLRAGAISEAAKYLTLAGQAAFPEFQGKMNGVIAPSLVDEVLAIARQGLESVPGEVAHTPSVDPVTVEAIPGTFRGRTPVSISTIRWSSAASTVLQWIELQQPDGVFRLTQNYVPVFGLIALAAQSRTRMPNRSRVEYQLGAPASSFAKAIGLEHVLSGDHPFTARERDRTVPLGRVAKREEVLLKAAQMAQLVLPGEEYVKVRRTVEYSLVELFRNVVQHSQDPLGGIAAAQSIPAEHGPSGEESVQIAVADAGIGIEKSLASMHPDVANSPLTALQKALRPHISGAFPEGDIGYEENAGLGLYFLTRIAIKLGGRFLIATKGAALAVEGSKEVGHASHTQILAGLGYPGTLVALEIPRHLPQQFPDSESLLESIRSEVAGYHPDRKGSVYWLDYSEPQEVVGSLHILVSVSVSDFSSMAMLVNRLLPEIVKGRPIQLDFKNVPFITDSMAHELVAKLVREAYKVKTKVYIYNATHAIVKTLDFVQQYALSDLAESRRWSRKPPRIIPRDPPGV